jgi:hypothetical protein
MDIFLGSLYDIYSMCQDQKLNKIIVCLVIYSNERGNLMMNLKPTHIGGEKHEAYPYYAT